MQQYQNQYFLIECVQDHICWETAGQMKKRTGALISELFEGLNLISNIIFGIH